MPQHVGFDGLREHTIDPAAVYEITLQSAPPAGLTARFPSIVLYVLPTVTVLSRQLVDATEVDSLIERLRSIGITPLEVHASHGCCEFWIEGRLSEVTLRYMHWDARLDRERTMMRIETTQSELLLILHELADSGVRIDHFVRKNSA